MIKAIFFDVDGTLLSHKTKSVPSGTRQALAQLRNRGIKTVIATGRHLQQLEFLLGSEFEYDGYITLNGQLCFDGAKRLLYGDPINAGSAEVLIGLFEQGQIPIMLVEEDKMYMNFVNDTVRAVHEAICTPLPMISAYSGRPIYMAIAYLPKGGEDAVARNLSGCRFTRWCDQAVDIIPNDGGKISGIKKYLEAAGLQREEIAAFGDGENDIEMLRYAGLGIAMGNAGVSVQREADYVTADVDDDGIMKALRHFNMI